MEKEHEYQELILSPSSTLCATSPASISPQTPSFPRLQIDSLDTSPFSHSFSGLIEEELEHSGNVNTSYDIQCFNKNSELGVEWVDQDVDEVLVIRPKPTGKLSTIEEETQRSGSIEVPRLAEFDLISEEPESTERARLYRRRNNSQVYIIKAFRGQAKPLTEQLIFNIVENLKAPFLPQVYRTFYEVDCFFTVTEYHSRENLQDLVRMQESLNAETALFYASELIQAIGSLHEAGIIHRNLHPEIIMIDNAGHIIVEGLEHSELLCSLAKGGDLDTRLLSKPPNLLTSFSAPEILLNWAHEFSVDCWAFGMLLLFMLSGKHFPSDCHPPSAWKDLAVREPVELSCIINFTARDLIAKCLERNPAVRLNISGIKSHAYFSTVDWKKVAAKRVRVPLRCNPLASESDASVKSNLSTSEAVPSVVSLRSRATSCSGRMSDSVSDWDFRRTARLSSNNERPPILSRLFRTSSLLESSPKVMKTTSPPDLNVHSTLTLHDRTFSNNDTRTSEKMAAFWHALDLAETSVSTPAVGANAVSRPRKLRKSRSLFSPGKISFNTSTPSLHDQHFKKKNCSFDTSLPPVVARLPPAAAADLPNGVKQIGSGIGFTYNTPAAAVSKVSICTDIPKGCPGILPRRLLNLRFGSRSPSALAKAKAKRILLLVSDSDHGGSSGDIIGPDQSTAPPLPSDILNIGAEATHVSIQSGLLPLQGLGQAAPTEERENASSGTEFYEDGAREAKVGDTETTLRLVTPSKVEKD